MAHIFISYRRTDSALETRRIYDYLRERLASYSVFMDLEGIEPGEDFRGAIDRELDSAQVMLVIIGRAWTAASDDYGLRLESPRDVVRQEILRAFSRRIQTVPVLVSGARMPRAEELPRALGSFCDLNAVELSAGAFEESVHRLIEAIERCLSKQKSNLGGSLTGNEPIPKKKVCMVGAFGVGKTSLVSRYVRNVFGESYLTTLGVRISKKELALDGNPLTLILWDLAGEDSQVRIKEANLQRSTGIILVADVTRPYTIEVALELRERCATVVGRVPFVLAVNKVDLLDTWDCPVGIALQKIIDRGELTVFTTSARTGTGVEMMFEHLARKILGLHDSLG